MTTNTKSLRLGVAALALTLVLSGCMHIANNTNQTANTNTTTQDQNTTTNTNTATPQDELVNIEKNLTVDLTIGSQKKEVEIKSFYEIIDGQPKPQYSVKEIKVKKGDTVRIKITNIKGNHDFNLDEFNIKQATPLDEEVVIEFTADKVGEFQYYCSMPGHRANGHWGTLIVTE